MSYEYLDINGLRVFKEEEDALLAQKQDALISGTTIKTINGASLLGAGNLNVGADAEVVTLSQAEMMALMTGLQTGVPTHVQIADVAQHPDIMTKDAVQLNVTEGFSFTLHAILDTSEESTSSRSWSGVLDLSANGVPGMYYFVSLTGSDMFLYPFDQRNYFPTPAEFDATAQYDFLSQVMYNGSHYICKVDQATQGSFVASEWLEIVSGSVLAVIIASFTAYGNLLGLVPSYDPSLTYHKGDLVLIHNLSSSAGYFSVQLFEAKQDINTPETWTSSHWQQKWLADVFATKQEVADTQAMIAPAYSESATYNEGDLVIYQNALYRCTTAIAVAEAWTAAHWTATTLAAELSH